LIDLWPAYDVFLGPLTSNTAGSNTPYGIRLHFEVIKAIKTIIIIKAIISSFFEVHRGILTGKQRRVERLF